MTTSLIWIEITVNYLGRQLFKVLCIEILISLNDRFENMVILKAYIMGIRLTLDS